MLALEHGAQEFGPPMSLLTMKGGEAISSLK